MEIKTLVENTAISGEYGGEHGLSLYIKMGGKKILFDVGASDLFLHNARKMNVDIADIDYLIISHGHYDHGGGLGTFLDANSKAKVFLNKYAFSQCYASREGDRLEYIGLDQSLKGNERIVMISDSHSIDKGIEVFSNVDSVYPLPTSNKGLFVKKNGNFIKDEFAHEQNLILKEDGRMLLVTGCAHNGIMNILEHVKKLGLSPDYVIGGFHLSSRSGGAQSVKGIEEIGEYLASTRAKYYTCHCTGMGPCNILRAAIGEKVNYLHAGSQVDLVEIQN